MTTTSFKPALALAMLAVGALLLGGCFGDSDGDSDGETVLSNASSISSVTISGTLHEASTVRVNGFPDSDSDPEAFSVTIPVSESSTGADLALMITASDGDSNSSSQVIDLVIVK